MKSTKQRAFAKHTPKWQRFQTTLMLPSDKSASQMGASGSSNKPTLHPYQRQYAHVYHQRLAQLKTRCWQAIEAKVPGNDGDIVKVERILDLHEEVLSIVVATVVKEGSGDEIHPKSRCQASQGVFIEDESGRVNLNVENVHDFCTGMILGLQGVVGKDGVMKIEEVFYPALPPQPSISVPSDENSSGNSPTGPPHVLLVSGLNCGDPDMSPMQRDMLLSYLRGHFTDTAAKVAHVIVAGGSTVEGNALSTVGLKELDGFCLQICAAGVPVDILPGKDDPTTANWPQRPLHGCLVKYTDRHATHMLSRAPNPYAAYHSDKYMLGTDGTNVTDLSRSLLTTADKDTAVPVSNLEALRRTLMCGHVCPTGPDTVPTMPHAEQDPMVIPETPHIYFAGNCETFATDVVEENDIKCRLICVPKFSETGEAVLVNLESLKVELLRFEDPY